MSWVAVAVGVGSAVVGAYGANKQANAAKKAGQAGENAAAQSNELEWKMYNQSRQDAEPWRQAGNWGLQQYMALLGAPQSAINGLQTASQPQLSAAEYYLQQNPDVAASGMDALDHYNRYGKAEGRQWGVPQTSLSTSNAPAMAQGDITSLLRKQPGYQFAFDEGQRALESGAAARGGLFSGKAGKELVQYGQNVGDQNYTNVLNRYASLAGIGQTQNQQNAQMGQNLAGNVSNNLMQGANARASGLVGSANAWGNYGNQLVSGAGYALGQYYGRK